MPCAIVIGCAPVIVFTGPQKLAVDFDEIGVAGALAGAPIRMARAATIDLDVPADAEIVIEGLIDPELLEPEGPFGESHGHVALEDFNMSMQVTAITHKRAPVFVSIISQVTPSESSVIKKVAYEPMFLAHLRDQLAIKGIRGVVLHEPLSNVRPVIFLRFAPGTARTEVWRGLHGAATLRADCGKIVVAVSEDIDPTNTACGVLVARLSLQAERGRARRALSLERTRSEIRPAAERRDPARSTPRSSRRCRRSRCRRANSWSARAASGRNSACRRSRRNRPGTAIRSATGATPGKCSRSARFAGQWEASGAETFARRRGGLTPETPVREVEK